MISIKKLLYKMLSRMNSNGFASTVNLASYTSSNYTFPSDGYVVASCGSASNSKAVVQIYDRTANMNFTIGGWGNGTYMAHAMFVKKGMQARAVTIENNGVAYFCPLV